MPVTGVTNPAALMLQRGGPQIPAPGGAARIGAPAAPQGLMGGRPNMPMLPPAGLPPRPMMGGGAPPPGGMPPPGMGVGGPPPGMGGPPPGAGAGGPPPPGGAPGVPPQQQQMLAQMLAKTLSDQQGNAYLSQLLDKIAMAFRGVMPHKSLDNPDMLSDASDILKKVTALKSKLNERGPQVGPPMTSTIAQLAGQTAGGLGAADGGANPPTAYPLQ